LVGLTVPEISAVALHEQALQPPHDVIVDLPKLNRGIARAEVRAPTMRSDPRHRSSITEGLSRRFSTDLQRDAGEAETCPAHGQRAGLAFGIVLVAASGK
jgi:hypothetical protein